jgi:hypothetical protein
LAVDCLLAALFGAWLRCRRGWMAALYSRLNPLPTLLRKAWIDPAAVS